MGHAGPVPPDTGWRAVQRRGGPSGRGAPAADTGTAVPPAPPEPEAPEPEPPETVPELSQDELEELFKPPKPEAPEPERPTPVPPPPPPPWRPIAILAAGGGAVLLVLLLAVNIFGGGGGASASPGSGTASASFSASDTQPTGGPPSDASASASIAPPTGGTGILFEFDPDGTDGEDSEIYLIDPDTLKPDRLTDNSVPDRWPRWSPDGTHIAFTRINNGTGDIYTMDKDGGNQTPMTSGPADDRVPDFARNKFIYFNSDRDETNKQLNDIWRVSSLRAGLPKPVVGQRGADDSSPAWDPDSARMAFTSNRDSNDDVLSIYIWVPGRDPEPLTSGGTVDRNPRWHPDGGRLVFTRNEPRARRDIWSIDVETREESRITDDSADEGGPVYSPEGDRIAFYRRVGDEWHILVRVLATGKEEDLTKSLGGDSIDPSWR